MNRSQNGVVSALAIMWVLIATSRVDAQRSLDDLRGMARRDAQIRWLKSFGVGGQVGGDILKAAREAKCPSHLSGGWGPRVPDFELIPESWCARDGWVMRGGYGGLIAAFDQPLSSTAHDAALAIWSIANIHVWNENVSDVLMGMVGSGICPDCRAAASAAIGFLAGARDERLLDSMLKDGDPVVIWGLVLGIGWRDSGWQDIEPFVLERLAKWDDEIVVWLARRHPRICDSPAVARAVERILARGAREAATAGVVSLLASSGIYMVRPVREVLLKTPPLEAEGRYALFCGISLNPRLARAVSDRILEEVRVAGGGSVASIYALRHLEFTGRTGLLSELLSDPARSDAEAVLAAQALAMMDGNRYFESRILDRGRGWKSGYVGDAFIDVLEVLGTPGARARLRELAHFGDGRTKAKAEVALSMWRR